MYEEPIEYAWIQLSDLHIFDNTEWNVMKHAYRNLPNHREIKFIVVTGDLHQYKSDYVKTQNFLENLLDFFELSKKDIFIIPGNHDSGRCESKDAFTFFIENNVDENPDCFREYFTKGKLIDCFADYNNFIKNFYGNLSEATYQEPEQVRVLKWNNKINIIHLNTAINCNGNNKLEQIIDVYNFSDLGVKLDNNCPSIIIAHHPFEKIHASHRNIMKRYISDWKVSAYLCGDLHKEMYSQIETYSDSGSNIPCIVCAKSAPEIGDTYSDLGCIIYIKRKNKEIVDVVPYMWDDKRKTFEERGMFDNNKGRLSFPLLNFQANDNQNIKKDRRKVSNLSKGESIWLPDAEYAKGKQSRFGDFTPTDIIEKFIGDDSQFWGLAAVKGIGKTFVLQIKRSRCKEKLCLPLGQKPSADNGWGTDTIRLEDKMDLSYLKDFGNVVSLWRYGIAIYVINQLINMKHNVKVKNWFSNNPEEHLLERLNEYLDEEKISKETYLLCTRDDYSNLDLVIKGVLENRNWTNLAVQDGRMLVLLKKRIEDMLGQLGKKSIAIFIDKVDQALTQVSAEAPINCEDCKKANKIQTCTDKSEDYCKNVDTLCRNECCYGCEKYETPYSGTDLRVYGGKSNKYKHINVWQYVQLGLLKAVSEIKIDFKGKIEVYFTIREEAFSCEADLFGEHGPKIFRLTNELWYTKEEQEQIFYDCIKNQQDEFLFDPSLKNQPERVEEAFVGVSKLCHPYARELTESVFESIYRHSFDRTRDIQEYGEMLTNNMDKIRKCKTDLERGEKVKWLIEEKAAELAFYDGTEKATKNKSYYVEKMNLLPNYWAETENFKRLLMMFTKNLMFGQEAKVICKKFNNRKKCAGQCSDC